MTLRRLGPLLGALSLLLAAGVAGCAGDECSLGDAYCSGNELVVCREGPRELGGAPKPVWDRDPCVGKCVESSGSASCEPQPDARCTAPSVCDGNALLICDDAGRLLDLRQCEALCLEATSRSGPQALCALAATPEPNCDASDDSKLACFEGSLARCQLGFATEKLTLNAGGCSSEQVCVMGVSGGLCAVSEQKDPRCPDSAGYDLSCVGGEYLECHDGFLIRPPSGSC